MHSAPAVALRRERGCARNWSALAFAASRPSVARARRTYGCARLDEPVALVPSDGAYDRRGPTRPVRTSAQSAPFRRMRNSSKSEPPAHRRRRLATVSRADRRSHAFANRTVAFASTSRSLSCFRTARTTDGARLGLSELPRSRRRFVECEIPPSPSHRLIGGVDSRRSRAPTVGRARSPNVRLRSPRRGGRSRTFL